MGQQQVARARVCVARGLEVPAALFEEAVVVEHVGRVGRELERALKSGAIALLDGRWLVACAERGERIRRRQDLPPEAFISLEELKAALVN